jgi:CRP-like cAMP-binding protein
MDNKIHLFDQETEFSSYAAGKVIFQAGDVGDFMYVVKEGTVQIAVQDRVVDTLGAGSVFGEMALIDDLPRAATATTVTECKLVLIDRRRFGFLVQQTPYFALQLLRIVSSRLRHMDELVT